MPFYPTPDRDDGYDIVDFYGVDPRLGTLGDLVEVIRTARDRGMRVIADLVVNHTSDKHPWFKAARANRTSKYRDFYVWSDQPPAKNAQAAPTFPDQETSVWTFDEQAGQYYLHRFYKHQPDLNVANPLVRDEIAKIMGYWVQLGLSGFRVDAVPFFLETMGVPDGKEALPDPHEYLRDLRVLAQPADRRRDPAGRGQPVHKRPTAVLRRRRRRRAAHAVRLHRDAAALPLVGPRATPPRWSMRWRPDRSRSRRASGPASSATTTS